jgi:RNA polymerase sigma-70 factor (ECF subfamily)
MRAKTEETSPEGSARASLGASDAELLRAIAASSEPAFEELRRRYRRAVVGVCGSVGADREDCEQEVFARVWIKAALFDPTRGSASAWLMTLTRRTAINVRAGWRHPWPIDGAPEVEAEPANDVAAFWLEAALARLTDRERTVIELAYYSDLSDRAIATRLQLPLGSVKSWRRRGLNRLASLLGDELP